MSKYVVVTFPEVQHLMDKEGFEENAYLINDEHGIEEFGSSAYFVDEDWLNHTTGKLTECAKEYFVQDVVCDCVHTFEHEQDYDLDEPIELSDGRIAKGFYEDDGNEDVRVVITDKDGNVVEDAFLSSMPVDDAYAIAKRIVDGEYTCVDGDKND